VVELAHTLLQTIKPPKRKKASNAASDASIAEHDKLVANADSGVAICYTDGSASPNPGPSGSGATFFVQNPGLVVDLGKSRGHSTNNAAELFALGMLALKLVDLLATHPHVKRAVVFCDSKIAIDACERPKNRPKNLANAALTRALRKAIDLASSWISAFSGLKAMPL